MKPQYRICNCEDGEDVGYLKAIFYWDAPRLDKDILLRLDRNDPDLTHLIVTKHGWIKGAGRIIGSNTNLKALAIYYDDFNCKIWIDDLCHGLSCNRTIEYLLLRRNSWKSELDISPVLSSFLEHNSRLRCIIDSGTSVFLSPGLSRCKIGGHLERINVSAIDVSCERAVAFFEFLSEQPKLTNLIFGTYSTNIDDHCITVLANALTKHNCLLSLSLSGIQLTNRGWKIFSSILSHPCCEIESIQLECDVDAIHLMKAIAANKKLKHLYIRGKSPEFTSHTWNILYRALCDKSSIVKRYSSNHTFHSLVLMKDLNDGYDDDDDLYQLRIRRGVAYC